MPFPEKEIEETYEMMLPIFQGCFREDLELLETIGTIPSILPLSRSLHVRFHSS